MSDDWSLEDLTPTQAEIDLEALESGGRTSELEPEGTESDLEEADRRKAARDMAAGESLALNAEIDALLNPPAAPDPEEEVDDSPLGRRLAGMEVGSPELGFLISELVEISRERQAREEARAAESDATLAAAAAEPEMAMDARDWSLPELHAITGAALGGDRNVPPGSQYSPREWRLLLASQGIT